MMSSYEIFTLNFMISNLTDILYINVFYCTTCKQSKCFKVNRP